MSRPIFKKSFFDLAGLPARLKEIRLARMAAVTNAGEGRGSKVRKMTQEQFGAMGGVNRVTQLRYEQGTQIPELPYLIGLAANDVDVLYLLTGIRTNQLRREF